MSKKMDGFMDEFSKLAGGNPEAIRELIGLGLIAAPAALSITNPKAEKKHGKWMRAMDIAGLGTLAYPYAKHLLTKK